MTIANQHIASTAPTPRRAQFGAPTGQTSLLAANSDPASRFNSFEAIFRRLSPGEGNHVSIDRLGQETSRISRANERANSAATDTRRGTLSRSDNSAGRPVERSRGGIQSHAESARDNRRARTLETARYARGSTRGVDTDRRTALDEGRDASHLERDGVSTIQDRDTELPSFQKLNNGDPSTADPDPEVADETLLTPVDEAIVQKGDGSPINDALANTGQRSTVKTGASTYEQVGSELLNTGANPATPGDPTLSNATEPVSQPTLTSPAGLVPPVPVDGDLITGPGPLSTASLGASVVPETNGSVEPSQLGSPVDDQSSGQQAGENLSRQQDKNQNSNTPHPSLTPTAEPDQTSQDKPTQQANSLNAKLSAGLTPVSTAGTVATGEESASLSTTPRSGPTTAVNSTSNTNTSTPNTDPNVARVVRGLNGVVHQNGGSVAIRMNPPELGMVHIRMKIQQGVVTAQIRAENETVRNLLNTQLGQLRHSLEGQGLTVERLVVQSNGQEADSLAQERRDNPGADEGRSRGRQERERQGDLGPGDRESEQDSTPNPFDEALNLVA